MANRQKRQQIAKETLEIQDKGFYCTNDGKTVPVAEEIKYCNENSTVHTEKDHKISVKKPDTTYDTQFEVSNEHAISACLRLAGELPQEEKICCLNFASAKNVCGGMIGGSLAQEESLGLCSSLHSSLSQFNKEYYDINRKDPKDGLYNNILMYSPDCLVFREDISYTLLEEPVKVSFISSPAVNKGVALQRGVKPLDISQEMLARMQHVLAVAMEKGHKVIVLGAWGCGVFHNDPNDIAMQFAQCLQSPNSRFFNVFQKVLFAVGKEEKKLQVFRNVFES